MLPNIIHFVSEATKIHSVLEDGEQESLEMIKRMVQHGDSHFFPVAKERLLKILAHAIIRQIKDGNDTDFGQAVEDMLGILGIGTATFPNWIEPIKLSSKLEEYFSGV